MRPIFYTIRAHFIRFLELRDEASWSRTVARFVDLYPVTGISNPEHIEGITNAIRLALWQSRFEAMRSLMPGDLTGKIKQPKLRAVKASAA